MEFFLSPNKSSLNQNRPVGSKLQVYENIHVGILSKYMGKKWHSFWLIEAKIRSLHYLSGLATFFPSLKYNQDRPFKKNCPNQNVSNVLWRATMGCSHSYMQVGLTRAKWCLLGTGEWQCLHSAPQSPSPNIWFMFKEAIKRIRM